MPAGTRNKRIIFVTGTDTGVGKTLLTGLLLHHLRCSGCHALVMKPFCCGGTTDIDFLGAIQDGELQAEEINPFYFREPVAPLIAARMHRRVVRMKDVLQCIRRIAKRCDHLIVEGCGGVSVPLGEGFAVGDLIRKLDCGVIVVSRNRLGTVNHTLLTVDALRTRGLKQIQVVLTTGAGRDFSSRSNLGFLAQLLFPTRVVGIPFLGRNACSIGGVKRHVKKIQKTLAQLVGADNLSPVPPIVEEWTSTKT